jgi:nucleoside triphosphate diphosphatase
MDTIVKLLEIMSALRDPDTGCPWDRQQDFKSIASFTLEEAYEVVDAIDRNDREDLCAELGDLLFQVVYHAQMAREKDWFDFNDVVENISNKLLERHPHVFGDVQIDSAGEQTRAWEINKIREQRINNSSAGILANISLNLPALARARKLQVRAATVGFDWQDIRAVQAKLAEEFQELTVEIADVDNMKIEEELGDLLFSCVNLARHLQIDAESALRKANIKFENRFRYIEQHLASQGKSPEQVTLEEMDQLWQKAKDVATGC